MKKAKKPDGCIKQLEWQSFWGQHFGAATAGSCYGSLKF